MEELLRFLKQNELWIYAFLGFVFVIYLRKLGNAWQEWKSSLFGLEKENAQRRVRAALTMVGLLGLMIFSEFVMISFVMPAYPQSMLLPTPTLDLLSTPTPTLDVLGAGLGTRTSATSQSSGGSGCVDGQLEWIVPAEGEEVSGAVVLEGTVSMTNMAFYKFLYSVAGSNSWVTIAAGNEPKLEAPLGGSWDTRELVPGDYTLRLVITDNMNTELPPCDVSVRVLSSK